MTADGAFPPELVDAAPVAMPEEPAAVPSPERRRTGPSKPRPVPAARPSRSAQVPPAAAHVEIDSRSAAALRLSAVESAMALPASSEVEPDTDEILYDAPAAPAHEPAWLRVQREAAEPEPDRSIDFQDTAPAPDTAEMPATEEPATEEIAAAAPVAEEPIEQEQATFDMPVEPPATPWPPLGASWPAREKPGAPWPAPDAADVPAVVAAGQAPAQTMAEMWAQSAQEVLNRGSVRVCHHCALPVSTKARFCRRCGTQQA
jgi:ribosomal protein L40E